MSVGAIIVAAGKSSRMGGIDKLLAPLGGHHLIARTVQVFLDHPAIDFVTVAASPENQGSITVAVPANPKLSFVLGGGRRRDSVRAGLMALAGCEYVIVHDGARPLVTPNLIDRALDGARECGAALCAIPVTDTVKRADASGHVKGTVSREGLWLAQTPQAFRRDLLMRAHEAAEGDVTDDAAMVELMGEPVRLVWGSRGNIKVTTVEDLALAEALLAIGV